MTNNFLLEITVESVDAALAAQRGGADRIELCADLHCGGLAPTVDTMREARPALQLPIFAMIRPRAGNFVYTNDEISLMKSQIAQARDLRMDGIVLGVLLENNTVDVSLLKSLVEFAAPLPLTFHRAFDETPDLFRALEDVISAGATRILTSGGASKAPQGLDTLARLVQIADQRIIIVPGSGIHPENFATVRKSVNAREYHSGLSSVLPYGSRDFASFEAAVRALAQAKREPD
ncbi:MAG TPA: copper homeostasis protein CutC [Candidatus Acidoferrum sp.]|jgi:copper homeostasis protein